MTTVHEPTWGDLVHWGDLVTWWNPIQRAWLVIEPSPGGMDDHDRPFRRTVKGQRFPGLWAHVRPPTTMRGILLWKDGRTQVVDSWDDYELYWDADDRIAGGCEVAFDVDDWQYAVLATAGFQFVDQDGTLVTTPPVPPPPPIVDDYEDIYDPAYD